MNLEAGRIAICTPCGSMISTKAAVEADKVRQELGTQLNMAMIAISALELRVKRLEAKT